MGKRIDVAPFQPKKRDTNKHLMDIINSPEQREKYKDFFRSMTPYKEEFKNIPIKSPADNLRMPGWVNGWIPGLDSMALYGFVAQTNPEVYFEIGSGNSTKFVNKAIENHNLRTKIISVDPHPRRDIDKLCERVYRKPAQDVDISVYENLPEDTVFFMDGSHQCFQNSDVTVFFTEIVPSFKKGVVWGIHDMNLPYDYNPPWYTRYYNEQYVMAAYLLGGHVKDDLLFATQLITFDDDLIQTANETVFNDPYFDNIVKGGGSLWFRRTE